MEQYISQSALVAEIEKRRSKNSKNKLNLAAAFEDNYLLSFIDSLEVKEVDLEKTINDYFKDWKFDEELDIMIKPNNYSATFDDMKEVARHFYKLGLKTQKGE